MVSDFVSTSCLEGQEVTSVLFPCAFGISFIIRPICISDMVTSSVAQVVAIAGRAGVLHG